MPMLEGMTGSIMEVLNPILSFYSFVTLGKFPVSLNFPICKIYTMSPSISIGHLPHRKHELYGI